MRWNPELPRQNSIVFSAASPPVSALVQRKANCACEGGCPHCQERHSLQPKLRISTPEDILEREADRIADQVISGKSTQMTHSSSRLKVQRSCDYGGGGRDNGKCSAYE